MSCDSLIRLRQLNTGEVGDFVLELIGRTATGLQMTGTGVLTGAFYPRYQNPSGYITGLNTGEFVTNTSLAISQDVLFDLVSGLFYLKSNPSGYINQAYVDSGFVRVYPYANSGVEFYDDPSNTIVFSFKEGSHFYLQSNQGKSIVDISGTVFGVPTISGLNIHASSIKVNGQNVLTDSGSFISKTDDANNTRLYLYDGITVDDPFAFKQNSNFWLKGYDNSAIIDLYDSTRGGTAPYISGFEIYSNTIYLSGIPLTVSGISGMIISGGGVTYAQLTGTSGALCSQIETVRTNLVLTGQKIGPPATTPRIFYLTKDATAYSGKLYTAFSTISSLFSYLSTNSINNFLVYIGTGNFGSVTISNKNFGSGIFSSIYDYPVDKQATITFTTSTGYLSLSKNVNFIYFIGQNCSIIIDGGISKDYAGSSLTQFGGSQAKGYFKNFTGIIESLGKGYLTVENSVVDLKAYSSPFIEYTPLASFTGIRSTILRVEALSGLSTPYLEECIISGSTQLPKNTSSMPFLIFSSGGKTVGYPEGLYKQGGALSFDNDLWLVKATGDEPTYDQLLTKASGDTLYYSSSNPNTYVTANYVATFYAQKSDAALLNDTTHNTNFHLYNPKYDVSHLTFTESDFALYGTGGAGIDFNGQAYGLPTIIGFNKISSNTKAGTEILFNDNNNSYFASEPYISGFHIDSYSLKTYGQYVLTGLSNIGKGIGIVSGHLANKSYLKSLSGQSGIRITDYSDYILIENTGSINGNILTGLTVTGGSPLINTVNLTGINIALIESGQTIIFSGISGSNVSTILGLPTDGVYGGSNGPIAGVEEGDTPEDAFDKVEVILGKLAPAKPSNLSAATFALSNSTYSAIEQGTSTTRTNILNGFRPTGFATGFYDGDAGSMSAYINDTLTGYRTLTTGSDIGTYTGLGIYEDKDFWSGVAGKEGFWRYINARVFPTGNLNSGRFTMYLSHSDTGPTSPITGYCDGPLTPSVTITNALTGASTTRIIDGVPSMATNDPITVYFTLNNAVSAFYRAPIANLDSSYTTSVNINATGTPLSGTSLNLSGTTLVETSKYITAWTPSVFGYNSAGGVSSTATSGTNIRIDTVSTQPSSRRKAGSGRYPTIFGDTYNNNDLLTANEELQLINGSIQYPPSINYTTNRPAGPNYSNISTGSFITGGSGYRWCCFSGGVISADSSINIGLNSAVNFGSNAIEPGFFLYIKVSGATPTAGWIDGNAAYPGVGSPTNDGDPALVVGSSSSTARNITFGGTPRDGTVWVRIGLPSGSTKTFADITMT